MYVMMLLASLDDVFYNLRIMVYEFDIAEENDSSISMKNQWEYAMVSF